MLVVDMGEPIVNRNDYQYTSGMETIVMDVDTTTFPAYRMHLDDWTACQHEACDRDTFVRGGRPEHPDNLAV